MASGFMGGGGERRLDDSDVTGIEPRIGMQYGSRPYYDIAVLTRDGRKVLAGTGIRDKREAEWLVALMRHEMKGEAL